MFVNVVRRCSEVVTSPVRTWSEMVLITRARLPAQAAFIYRADASISTQRTPILRQLSTFGWAE